MACDCKVNKQILKLHKEYGAKIYTPWKERMKFNLEEGLKFILIALLAVLCFPIFFIFVLCMTFKGNQHFNVNNLLRFILRKDE